MQGFIIHILILFCNISYASVSGGGDYIIDNSTLFSGGSVMSYNDYRVMGVLGSDLSNTLDTAQKNEIYKNRTGFYNPPHFAYQKVRDVIYNNRDLDIYIPANAIDLDYFDLLLNDNKNDITSDYVVKEANIKAERNYGIVSNPVSLINIDFFDDEKVYNNKLREEGRISFKIKDEDRDGNVDGTYPPVKISTIRGYVLDRDSKLWVKVFNNNIDPHGILTFNIRKTGIYAIMGHIDDSVEDVYAYPVPFRPNGPNSGSGAGQTGTNSDGITFINIPQTGYIEIYTITGRLVKKITIPFLSEAKIKWDVKNDSGEDVGSGVYIWRVVSGKNSKMGKLVIIR